MSKNWLLRAVLLFSILLLSVIHFSCKGSAPPLEDGIAEPATHGPALIPGAEEDEGQTGEETLAGEEEMVQPGDSGEAAGGVENGEAPGQADSNTMDIAEVTFPPETFEETRPLLAEPLPPSLLPLPEIQGMPDSMLEETPPAALSPPALSSLVMEQEEPQFEIEPGASEQTPSLPESTQRPPEQIPPAAPREAPAPPAFLRSAEPENFPQARPPASVTPAPSSPAPAAPTPNLALPNQEIPGPELPARISSSEDEDIVFSRVVRATVGQIIEIPFRGTGWVYLGELGNRRGIAYDSRRLDLAAGSNGAVEGQSFIFSAEAAGTYILKFYKQYFIQDYVINDYVQVIVGEASDNSGASRFGYPVDRGRVIAEPRWPLVSIPAEAAPLAAIGPAETAPAADEFTETSPAATPAAEIVPMETAEAAALAAAMPPQPEVQTGPAAEAIPVSPGIAERPRQSSPDDSIVVVAPPQAAVPSDSVRAPNSPSVQIPDNAPPSEYVRLARLEFDSGRVESALSIMDRFRQSFPSGTDEAWWLYGQLLESNSSSRDVRLALDYYRRLVREYPQSPRVADAQRRIAYLERYYLNIR